MLPVSLRSIFSGLIMLCVPTLAFASSGEPPSVNVNLWNKGDKDGITLSTHKVKAGPVEFHVTNTSTNLEHEFLIAEWNRSIHGLPYNTNKTQVKEGALPQLAGVEDMKPGAKAILRLSLKPGRYVAFCNEPGHYKAGMETQLTVTDASSSVNQSSSPK